MSHTFALHVPDELSLPDVLALNIDLDRPFGELSIDTRCLIFALHQAGKIDVTYSNGIDCTLPAWCERTIYQIRRKEAPLVPDSIDWSHVSPEWKFMARDENGLVYAYTERPEVNGSIGAWCYDDGRMIAANAFASYQCGTVDWKDSLVVRPE